MFDNEVITSAKELKLLLIACVSLRRSPVDPEDDSRSEPARSIKFKVPSNDSSVIEFFPEILRVKTLWLREDRSLQFVLATARFSEAFIKSFWTSLGLVNLTQDEQKQSEPVVISVTIVFPW